MPLNPGRASSNRRPGGGTCHVCGFASPVRIMPSTPADVGQAVATLAAGDLPFMTGAAIPVDGGMHIHQY